MSRKTIEIVIEGGRDNGRRYVITEMSASQAERWAIRALNAVARSGIEVPDDAADLGWQGIAAMGLKGILGVQFTEAQPLLDEMMTCVQIKMQSGVVRAINEDDIEDVQTRLRLRGEVVALHMGFSLAERLSQFRQLWQTTTAGLNPSSQPTSPEPSPSQSTPA